MQINYFSGLPLIGGGGGGGGWFSALFQDEMVRWEKSDHRMRNIVNDRENRRRLHEKEVKAADERIEK